MRGRNATLEAIWRMMAWISLTISFWLFSALKELGEWLGR